MFKSYDKFTNNFKKVIQRAAWLCLNDLKKIITVEHLFWGMVTVPESLAYQILKNTSLLGVIATDPEFNRFTKFTAINPNLNYDQVFSLSMDRETIEILEQAADLAVKFGANFIGTEHLLAAMIILKTPLLDIKIKLAGLDYARLNQQLEQILITKKIGQNKPAVPTPIAIAESGKSGVKHRPGSKDRPPLFQPTPALDYFTTDLTNPKKQADFHPIIGRDKVIDRLINILSRKRKNNPLLLGDPGVGKTAVVEGLAQRIVAGLVPDILINKKILDLDLNALVAGTIYRGEFENRLKQVIEEIKHQDDVILFIDEIHNLIGAGSASGSMDAANILKPYLARGEIACIGATTFAEYKAHFENDAALERRFQTVTIDEPTAADTLKILAGIRSTWEDYHRVTISDDALQAAVDLSERFMPNRFFPDKAIDLLDEAASRAKVENVKDASLRLIKNITDKLKGLNQEKETAVQDEDFNQAMVYKQKSDDLLDKLYRLKKKQARANKTKVARIGQAEIAQIITETVKIPFLEILNRDRQQKLLDLEQILGRRIRGQDAVLKEISKTMRRAEAGLTDPKRPLGSFIFLGPSGVGKTETAKVIAEEIFGDKNSLVRINMSEFHESFTATKLVGAPAGYVGYKDTNQLADKVRSKPYCVVLFDEMEKAHPDVFNLLLQVLEDGQLIDSTGKYINFKNTVIIFTSNIGLERFNQVQSIGFSADGRDKKKQLESQFSNLKENILAELYNNFRVEFLNRIDKILFFDPLTPAVLQEILELNIIDLNQRLAAQKITVTLTPSVKKYLAKISFSPDDGARSIRRVVQEQIEEILVEKILRGKTKLNQTVKISLQGQKVVIV